jgi:acyl CoA:acetate/3-ketoacid CoA transferase alpha subunit/acyl CoA:acetate/3-ketoacid CoA transferase beta subunit
MEHLSLADAVERHVRPGDAIHIFYGHSRWSALAREVCRQFWGQDPGFELQFLSLGNLATLFFHGRLLRRCVTSFVGNGFPTGGPNPIYTRAVMEGQVEVEQWSILTFQQRLEAAARGLPALVTGSLQGSDMAANDGFQLVDSRFGPVGLLSPMVPDVVLVHAPAADVNGNVAMSAPMMEGLWAAWAARRGALVTVDRVVDDLAGAANLVRLPSHLVLAVVETPFGAHPGGVFAPGLPAPSYGEDIPFWNEIAVASKGDYESWARQWCLDVPTQEEYLRRLGPDRLAWLEGRSDPESWRADADAHPVDETAPVTPQEVVAALSARELADRVEAVGADALLAGAGISNLAAWVAAEAARSRGSKVRLAAEMGMWGYTPTPADPYIFNHRSFPSSEMLTDCSTILGLVVRGPRTRVVGALSGAEIDRRGNINSTDIPATSLVLGSGGAADVVAGSDECVVSVVAHPRRLVERCAYVTSPGDRVVSVCTDLGVLRKREDGELHLSAVVAGDDPLDARVGRMKGACSWDLAVDRNLEEIPAPTTREVLALRHFDRERILLT